MDWQDVVGGNDARLASVFSHRRNISLACAHTFVRRDTDVKPSPLPPGYEGSSRPASGAGSVALALVEPRNHPGIRLYALQFGSYEVLCQRALPGKNAVPVHSNDLPLHNLSESHQHGSRTEAGMGCYCRRDFGRVVARRRARRPRYRFPIDEIFKFVFDVEGAT